MNEGTCIHFTDIMQPTCKAGVNYQDAFGKESGIVCRMACFQWYERPAHGRGTYIKPGEATIRKEIDRRGQTEIPCSLLLLPTAEQLLESRTKSEAHTRKVLAAIVVADSWRGKKKPDADRHEVVECPICKGKLHLSQSSYNGHVHGKCETADCVSWME